MSYVTKKFLHVLRTEFNKQSNRRYKTSHIAEALAAGYGYKSYASCLVDIKKHNRDINHLNSKLFAEKILSWYPDNVLRDISFLIALTIACIDENETSLWKDKVDKVDNSLRYTPDNIIIGETDRPQISQIFERIFNDVLVHPISDLSFTFRKENFNIKYRLHDSLHVYHHEYLSNEDISNLKSYLLGISGIKLEDIKKYPTELCQISKYINTSYNGILKMSACPLPGDGIYINVILYDPSINKEENPDIVFNNLLSNIITLQKTPISTTISIKFIDNDVRLYYETENEWRRYNMNLSLEQLLDLKKYFYKIRELEQSDDCNDITKQITIQNKQYLLKISMIIRENNDVDVIMRLRSLHIHSPQSLGIPSVIIENLNKPGVHLITGATGSGKTTALFSILQDILLKEKGNIITYENPIEFPLSSTKGYVIQNEGHYSSEHSRRKKDYLVIGESRRSEDIKFIMDESKADNKLKVFSTLHADSVLSIISRIINLTQDNKIDLNSIQTLVTQRLIFDNINKKRVLITEYLIFNNDVKNRLKDIPVNQWADEIKKIFKEHSGQNSDTIQCESFVDALLRAYKEERISLECLKENINLF